MLAVSPCNAKADADQKVFPICSFLSHSYYFLPILLSSRILWFRLHETGQGQILLRFSTNSSVHQHIYIGQHLVCHPLYGPRRRLLIPIRDSRCSTRYPSPDTSRAPSGVNVSSIWFSLKRFSAEQQKPCIYPGSNAAKISSPSLLYHITVHIGNPTSPH